MVDSLKYIISGSFNPYHNLALEEWLLFNVGKNELILYLWQNKNTVVIGKNQNPFSECKMSEIKNDNVHVARRLSGGGAVFHDLGNLNFTFITRVQNKNLNKQLNVIIKALRQLGLNAVVSGRNDITIDNKKISGNAFYTSNDYYYHHGTILVDVNVENLSKYLNVSQLKLKSKGVKSVKSRVVNLKEYKESLTIDLIRQNLVSALEVEYRLNAIAVPMQEIDLGALKKLEKKYSDDEFIFQKSFDYTLKMHDRFLWGEISILLSLQNDTINDVKVYSDAMDENFIESISKALNGCNFSLKAMSIAIDSIYSSKEQIDIMKSDTMSLIKKSLN